MCAHLSPMDLLLCGKGGMGGDEILRRKTIKIKIDLSFKKSSSSIKLRANQYEHFKLKNYPEEESVRCSDPIILQVSSIDLVRTLRSLHPSPSVLPLQCRDFQSLFRVFGRDTVSKVARTFL